jgi:hypothetical protein
MDRISKSSLHTGKLAGVKNRTMKAACKMWIAASVAACAPLMGLVANASGQAISLTYCNTITLQQATTLDQNGASFTLAGLSGITMLDAGTFAAVMDNSNKVVIGSFALSANGCLAGASISRGVSLSASNDYEGAAFDVSSGRLLLSDENTMSVRAVTLDTGSIVQVSSLPALFSAVRPNFGLESLSLAPDGSVLWTANEEALTVDGPLSTQSAGTRVRLVRMTRQPSGGFAAQAQYAYQTAPIHGSVITGARSGVSDLLVLPDGTLLTLERSFAFSAAGFFQTRIYEVSFHNASDVSGVPALGAGGGSFTPVSKRILWQGNLNNLEGLAPGPEIPSLQTSTSRSCAVLGIIDDGDPISVNAVASFIVTLPRCFADFNTDGGIDGGDIEAFFAEWEAGNTSADVNADGGVDGSDVGEFYEAWEQGGC